MIVNKKLPNHRRLLLELKSQRNYNKESSRPLFFKLNQIWL